MIYSFYLLVIALCVSTTVLLQKCFTPVSSFPPDSTRTSAAVVEESLGPGTGKKATSKVGASSIRVFLTTPEPTGTLMVRVR